MTATQHTTRSARRAQVRTYAGVRQTSFARSTGALVTVYDGIAQGMDTDGGRWQIVCEDHGAIVSVGRLRDARTWAACPEGFCEDCQAMLDGAAR